MLHGQHFTARDAVMVRKTIDMAERLSLHRDCANGQERGSRFIGLQLFQGICLADQHKLAPSQFDSTLHSKGLRAIRTEPFGDEEGNGQYDIA